MTQNNREESSWSNGSWSVSWKDADTVVIRNISTNVEALLHGGDFESALSALCAAYSMGERRGARAKKADGA